MEKIRLGRTGMMVSPLGLGGIPIQRLPEDEAVAVVRRCLELGVNFIDTADVYGRSEEYIGKAISGLSERPFIATKSDYGSRQTVAANLDQSLKRLGVDCIDLYQFHAVSDPDTLAKVIDPDGPMAVIREAMAAGVIKHLGISSHSLKVAGEAVKTGIFETVMFPFNFVLREAADELIPLARANDVGFIAMKPLNAGLIDEVPIAFKYLRRFPGIITIPGMEKIEQVEEIAAFYQGPPQMAEAETQRMLRLQEELGKRFCRRCGDCNICPEGIPVAMVMDVRGMMKSMAPEVLFGEHFSAGMDNLDKCTWCGECERICSYGLPVMELIKENAGIYRAEKEKYMASL